MATNTGARYHPWLYLLIGLLAIVELGLTAFVIHVGNEHNAWINSRYRSVVILFLFTACWTTVFALAYMAWILIGAVHALASMASSLTWLLITAILWGTAAGVMHQVRKDDTCAGVLASSLADMTSRCRKSLAIESIGWTIFALCLLTILATLTWARGNKRNLTAPYYVDRVHP